VSLKFDSVMVTGGCGFIGTHVVDELARKGVDVTVLRLFNVYGPTSNALGGENAVIPQLISRLRAGRRSDSCSRSCFFLFLSSRTFAFIVFLASMSDPLNKLLFMDII